MVYMSRQDYSHIVPTVPKTTPLPLPLSPLPIGSRIATLRKAKGLSQQALGELVGLSQKQLTDYETGKVHLNDVTIVRFALVLEASADTLLGLNDLDLAEETPSLRFTRRIRELNQLPEAKKKAILKTLDDLIRANS